MKMNCCNNFGFCSPLKVGSGQGYFGEVKEIVFFEICQRTLQTNIL